MLILMMMMAATKAQKSANNGPQQADNLARSASRKGANNKLTDTVIAPKQEGPQTEPAVKPADGRAAATSGDSQLKQADPERAPNATLDEASKRQGRLKSFLMFTSQLNPFQHQHYSEHRLHRTSSIDSDTDIKRNTGVFAFARRYLGRRSAAKSAPVTPVKLPPAKQDLECVRANGIRQDESTSELEKPAEPRAIVGLVAQDQTERSTQQASNSSLADTKATFISQKPSVRFVESLASASSSQRGAKEKLTKQTLADRAVQTSNDDVNDDDNSNSNNNNNCINHDNDEVAEDESDEVNVVAKLFKLPLSGDGRDLRKGECPMELDKFREHGCSLIDYISNYLNTINRRRVAPLNIEPGYLKSLIAPEAPTKGEPFAKIMHDFEAHIMCGITHWQHPHFHAYFPAGNAYPSILADMLSDALGCMGFSWAASPAYTELEIIMLNWMGKMIGLPDEFLCLSSGKDSKGGGVIQGSASECVLVNLLAARHWAIDKLRKKYPNTPDGVLLSKLIGYCSKEAHSCVEKAAMIGFIRMRALDTDDKHALRGETLARAIQIDKSNGLEPFLVCGTLGTTSCVSFDNIAEIGKICKEEDIWFHVDAAYAGSAFICPEFKYLMDGIELATSFNMNPNKWMLINYDCSLMWVKDRFKLTRAFVVDPLYLQHSFSDQAIDFRHWGIPLSRRFRALKLWFVIRNYGVEGLQGYIRNHVRLAKLFEQRIRQDSRFVITNEVVLGLVCFRLVGSNALNQRLLSMINGSGKLHMVPASLNGRYVIRFCVCDQNAKEADIRYAYKCISDTATELFESIRSGKEAVRALSTQNTVDVSSISLHTQQSLSTDRLESTMAPGLQQQRRGAPASTNAQQVSGHGKHGAANEAARHHLVRHGATTIDTESERSCSVSSGQRLGVTRSKSPLRKQASVLMQQRRDGSEMPELEDEDLEQEIVLDTSTSNDGYDCEYDLDLDANDLLEPAPYFNEAEGRAGGPAEVQSLSGRQWPARRPSRCQTAGCGGEQEEAEDEVFHLGDRRSRMSLRYKREFFVRVVSDPRVYRASISGDINTHASCCSLGSGPPVTQANQTTSGLASVQSSSAESAPVEPRP